MSRIGILASFAATIAASAAGQSPSAVLGRWRTDDGAAIVRIQPCGDALCGIIERVLDPAAPKRDINNDDKALRGRPLVDVAVLSGLHAKDGKWTNGKAYDPKTGHSYRANIASGPGGSLRVQGCVLLICQTRIWTRLAATFPE